VVDITLAQLLPGGMDNCSSSDDQDTHPTLGVGWWLYVNFTAARVNYTP